MRSPIALACLLLAGSAARADSLAVLELRSRLPEADRGVVDAAYLTDRVRAAALEAAPDLRVMTRENVVVILRSLGKTLEECEGECEVDTGRKLGADLVLSGEILRFGKSLKASLRLHDTRDGRLVAASVATGASPEELDAALPPAVQQLFHARKVPPASASAPAEAAVRPVPQEPSREEREAARGGAARRLLSGLALEARAMVPLSANFAPGPGVGLYEESGFYPGTVGLGLRLGAISWIDDSLGVRWGVGLDAKLARMSEAYGPLGTGSTEQQLLLSAPLHLGLVFPLAQGGSWGFSWAPSYNRRPSNSPDLGAITSVRFLGFEVHVEPVTFGDAGGKRTCLKIFLEVQPQVGIKDVGDHYTAYGSAGLGLSWY